jgi:hypothetical protein
LSSIHHLTSDNNIQFKLINFDQDTLLLSYFYDFIQLEIKGKNFVSDLNAKADYADLDTQQKCLNYPLQRIICRRTIESFSSSRKIPVYIRYCIDLILKELGEGDLMTLNKKYKYVKDLPMLISHFNLACKCATNLAQDFEYFAVKTVNTKIKCDFDFEK